MCLTQGLQSLQLPTKHAKALFQYMSLLLYWNRYSNLTRITEPEQMVLRHVLDALAIHTFIQPTTAQLADVGTGPGIPGIPLAIVQPSLHVLLIESNGKKVRFLREAVRQLQLTNVDIFPDRAEKCLYHRRFDYITARAVASLTGILRVGGHLLHPQGALLAMKGQRPDNEIAELPPEWKAEAIHHLRVPGLDAQRHLVVVRLA